jgi:hypothetical protein
VTSDRFPAKRGSSASLDPAVAAAELHAAIWQPDIELALFHCSPSYDLPALARELAARFEGVELIGCTTAGEISPEGYRRDGLTGVSFGASGVKAVVGRIDGLANFQLSRGGEFAERLHAKLAARTATPPSGENTFGYVMIDGLSMQEESVIVALYRSLGGIGLIGGSAADETRFRETFVYHAGAFHRDAAVFALVHTDFPFVVFKTQHFSSSPEKMVVTAADPPHRIVTEINGEPAGREYARAVGLSPEKLTPFIFASHPVVVRVGGHYYVRSIQKVNEDESLTFFCAIDTGVVLTVARATDLVADLRQCFVDVSGKIGPPEVVLGCDCLLRHLEIDQSGIKPEVSRIFVENNVVGFATYGEQFNAMHVNQTFTGVAIGRRGAHG